MPNPFLFNKILNTNLPSSCLLFQEIESLTDPIQRQAAQAHYRVAPPREQILLVRKLRDQHDTEVEQIHEVGSGSVLL
jgi:hypothetical protein